MEIMGTNETTIEDTGFLQIFDILPDFNLIILGY